ncbi:Spy/CpxP family protein refolding chaperone [Halioglobus maricola]|nr:Spy/CpxP family protein refolding chaperone [Halioglobus maricola]
MKNTLLKAIPAVALSGMLMATTGWAMGHGKGHDSEKMIERMADKLELTDSQRTQVEAVFAEDRAQMEADRVRIEEIREALSEQRSNFNAGTAQALSDELGEITARTTYEMTSNRAAVYQLLTDEQRAKMTEMQAKMSERKAKGKGRRGE